MSSTLTSIVVQLAKQFKVVMRLSDSSHRLLIIFAKESGFTIDTATLSAYRTLESVTSGADNTQLGKVLMLTSAKRPSVKYFSRDDFPTVESPMRMSLKAGR